MLGIRERSGEVNCNEKLVAFLYLLLRDELLPGRLEDVMKKLPLGCDASEFSNGWLALYAMDVAKRLK